MFYDVVTSPTAILRICLGVLRDVTVLEPHGLGGAWPAGRHRVESVRIGVHLCAARSSTDSTRPGVRETCGHRLAASSSWRIGAPFVSGRRAVHTRLTSTTIAIMAPSAGTPQVASNGAAMIVGKAPPINPARLRARPAPL